MDNRQRLIFCPYCGCKNRPERISCLNCETSLPKNGTIISYIKSNIIKCFGLIGTILLILGTAYYAVHIFPPGNADPLPPSSFAIVRGMSQFSFRSYYNSNRMEE